MGDWTVHQVVLPVCCSDYADKQKSNGFQNRKTHWTSCRQQQASSPQSTRVRATGSGPSQPTNPAAASRDLSHGPAQSLGTSCEGRIMAKETLRDVGDKASWGKSDNLTCWEALMGVEQASQLRGPHRAIQSSISTQGPSWGPPARRGPAWVGSASPPYKEAVMSASGSPPGSWALCRFYPDQTHASSAHCQSPLHHSTQLERRPLSEAA